MSLAEYQDARAAAGYTRSPGARIVNQGSQIAQTVAFQRRMNMIYNSGNPVMTTVVEQFPQEMAALATSPLTDQEFLDSAFSLAGQNRLDATMSALNSMGPIEARATWENLTLLQQNQLANIGYEPPNLAGEGGGGLGGLFGDIVGLAGDVMGFGGDVLSYPGSMIVGAVGGAWNALGYGYERINHLWRVAQRIDELGGDQFFGIPHLLAHPMDIQKAWTQTYDGERTITEKARGEANEYVDTHGLFSNKADVVDLAIELSAGTSLMDYLNDAGYVPNTPEHEEALIELQTMIGTNTFSELRRIIDGGKMSMGRYVATNYMGADPTEGWGMVLSGGVDLIWNLKMDPLAGLGRLSHVRKLKLFDLSSDANANVNHLLDLSEDVARGVDVRPTMMNSAVNLAENSTTGWFRGGPLSIDNIVDKIYSHERLARRSNEITGRQVNKMLDNVASAVADVRANRYDVWTRMRRDPNMQHWIPLVKQMADESYTYADELVTQAGVRNYLRSEKAVFDMVTATDLTGWKTGLLMLPRQTRTRQALNWTLGRNQKAFIAGNKGLDTALAGRRLGKADPENYLDMDTTEVNRFLDETIKFHKNPNLLKTEMSPEEIRRANPFSNLEELGPANRTKWSALASRASRLARKMTTLTPVDDIFDVADQHAIANFDDFLAFGISTGTLDERAASKLMHMFATGNVNQRKKVAHVLVGQMILDSGISNRIVSKNDELTWFQRFVSREKQMYGLNETQQALFRNQTSSAMLMPNFTEFYRAVNMVNTVRGASGLRRLHYDHLDRLMTRIWAPLQLIRPGFIFRAGGEEALQFMLNPRKGVANYARATFGWKWAMNTQLDGRVGQIHRSLVSGDYDRINTLMVRQGDQIVEQQLSARDLVKSIRSGNLELTTKDGGTVIFDPLDALTELDRSGRELLAWKPVTNTTHFLRSATSMTNYHIDEAVKHIIVRDKLLTDAARQQFSDIGDLERWATSSQRTHDIFYDTYRQVKDEYIRSQRKSTRALIWLDEMSSLLARSHGGWWHDVLHAPGAPTFRQRIGQKFFEEEQLNEYQEAIKGMFVVPGLQDGWSGVLSQTVFSPYMMRQANSHMAGLPGQTMTIRNQAGRKVRAMRMRSTGSDFQKFGREDQLEFYMNWNSLVRQAYDDAAGRNIFHVLAHFQPQIHSPGYSSSVTRKGFEALVGQVPAEQLAAEGAVRGIPVRTPMRTHSRFDDMDDLEIWEHIRFRNGEMRNKMRYTGATVHPVDDADVLKALDEGDVEAVFALEAERPFAAKLEDILTGVDADQDAALEAVFQRTTLRIKDVLGETNLFGAENPWLELADELEDSLRQIDRRFGTSHRKDWGDMLSLYRNAGTTADDLEYVRYFLDPTYLHRDSFIDWSVIDQHMGPQDFTNRAVLPNANRGQTGWPNGLTRDDMDALALTDDTGMAQLPPPGSVSGYVPLLPSPELRRNLIEVMGDPSQRAAWDNASLELVSKPGTGFHNPKITTPAEAGEFVQRILLGHRYDPGPTLMRTLYEQGVIDPAVMDELNRAWSAAKLMIRHGDEPAESYNALRRVLNATEDLSLDEDLVKSLEQQWIKYLHRGTEDITGALVEDVSRNGMNWAAAGPFAHTRREDALEFHAWLLRQLKTSGYDVPAQTAHSRVARADMPHDAFAATRAGRGEQAPRGALTDRESLKQWDPELLADWDARGAEVTGGWLLSPERQRSLVPVDIGSHQMAAYTDPFGQTHWMDSVRQPDGTMAPTPAAAAHFDYSDVWEATGDVIWAHGHSEVDAARILGARQADEIFNYTTTFKLADTPDEVMHPVIWAAKNNRSSHEFLQYKVPERHYPHQVYGPSPILAEEADPRNVFARGRDLAFNDIIGPAIDALIRTPHFTHQMVESVRATNFVYKRYKNLKLSQATSDVFGELSTGDEEWLWRHARELLPRIDEEYIQAATRIDDDPILTFFDQLRKGNLDLGSLEKIDNGSALKGMTALEQPILDDVVAASKDWAAKVPDDLADQVRVLLAKRTNVDTQVVSRILPDVDVTLTSRQRRQVNAIIGRHVETRRKTLYQGVRNESQAYVTQMSSAAKMGIRKTIPFIDDHRLRSQMQHQLTTFLPFWFAEEQFLKRTARLMIEAPEALPRAYRTIHGLQAMGLVEEDEYGNTMLTIPWSGELFDVFNSIVQKTWFGENFAVPIAGDISLNLQYLVPGFTEDVAVPQWGPAVSMPLAWMGDRFPEWRLAERKIANEDQDVLSQNILDYFVPGWAGRFYDASVKSPTELGSGFFQAAVILQSNPDTAIDETSSALEREEWLQRATNHSRTIEIARGFFNFIGGSTPSIVDDRYVELAEEFRSYLDGGIPWEDATRIFLELNPDAMVSTIFGTKSATGAPVPSTNDAIEWFDSNSAFVDAYPMAGSWMLPTEPGHSVEDDYSRRAQQEWLTNELRLRRAPEEVMTEMFFRQAANKYFPAQEQAHLEATRLRNEGLADEAALVEDEWAAYRNQFMATHPVFEAKMAEGGGRIRRKQTIDEMRQLLALPLNQVPRSNSWDEIRPLAEMLVEYEDARASLEGLTTGQISEARRIMRITYYHRARRYATLNPRAMVFFNSVVGPHLGGFETEVDTFGPDYAELQA